MQLASHYAWLKAGHVAFAALSVSLFCARCAGAWRRRGWPLHRATRAASVGIDVGLLTLGACLWSALGLNPLRNAWLGVKLLLIVAYIVTGSLALRRARTAPGRGASFVAAMLCIALIVWLATGHGAPWLDP